MKYVFNYLLSHALFGFRKAVFSYHNLAHLIFAKNRQILKELNWLPFSNRCASHFLRISLRSVISASRWQHGIFLFIFNVNQTKKNLHLTLNLK